MKSGPFSTEFQTSACNAGSELKLLGEGSKPT